MSASRSTFRLTRKTITSFRFSASRPGSSAEERGQGPKREYSQFEEETDQQLKQDEFATFRLRRRFNIPSPDCAVGRSQNCLWPNRL